MCNDFLNNAFTFIQFSIYKKYYIVNLDNLSYVRLVHFLMNNIGPVIFMYRKLLTFHAATILSLECSELSLPVISLCHKFNSRFADQNLFGNVHRSQSKPKRNGIVTNPALRIVPAIKNGLEMAAGRKVNNATTTNSFQWRKETPL